MDSQRLVMEALRQVAQNTPRLDLLMLYGSRARGDAHAHSDWDFAYLGTQDLDVSLLLGRLVEVVKTDRVDLADLRHAGGLLRYRAARDGQVLFEARPRLAETFCLEAAAFWCDAATILEQGYKRLLTEIEH